MVGFELLSNDLSRGGFLLNHQGACQPGGGSAVLCTKQSCRNAHDSNPLISDPELETLKHGVSFGHKTTQELFALLFFVLIGPIVPLIHPTIIESGPQQR